MSRNPLVVILGATGTGKSKLAIEIAKKFGGEIISADSMQVYKGLDIITNKVTDEEKEGIKHHMLDLIEPPAKYSVFDFRNKALPIINDLHRRGALPLVVGGTNYYIESLIWKVLVDDEENIESSFHGDISELVLNSQPVIDSFKSTLVLLWIRSILEVAEVAEKVFTSYLTHCIDTLPKFQEKIDDLLDSPPDCSEILLNLKATYILYEISLFKYCNTLDRDHNQVVFEFRRIEKLFLTFIEAMFNHEQYNLTKPDEQNEQLIKLQTELKEKINFMKSESFDNIDLIICDYSIPAEYKNLCLTLNSLKHFNSFTLIKNIIELFDKIMIKLDNETLQEMADETFVFSKIAAKNVMDSLDKIVQLRSLNIQINANRLSTEKNAKLFYELLSRMDPEMSKRLHPNDTRKVLRSIHVCLQKGRKHSEILDEQKQTTGGSSLGGPLRFQNTVIFWLTCEQEKLDVRLDQRVDEMMSRGLIDELKDFYAKYHHLIHPQSSDDEVDEQSEDQSKILDELLKRPFSDLESTCSRLENFSRKMSTPPLLSQFENVSPTSSNKNSAVYTQGIFQSIGFKEFDNYLKLSEDERKNEVGKKALDEGLYWLKLVTKRYAKRQNKWVNQRFIKTPDRYVPPVYKLDTSVPSEWASTVFQPACAVVSNLLNLTTDANVPLPSPESRQSSLTGDNKSNHYCDICDRVFIGDVQWNDHIKSKKHQKIVQKKRRGNPG